MCFVAGAAGAVVAGAVVAGWLVASAARETGASKASRVSISVEGRRLETSFRIDIGTPSCKFMLHQGGDPPFGPEF